MYKKMIWAFALLLALQGSAYATLTGVSIITEILDPNSIVFSFNPANNVIIDYYTVLTANPKVNYTTASKNTNGNRVYSTSNNTTSIWFQESDDWKGLDLQLKAIPNIKLYMSDVGQSTYTGWTGL